MALQKQLVQKLCYPMRYVNISQGSNGTYSHKGQRAIDLCGEDYKASDVFAQGSGEVIKIEDAAVTVRYPNVIGQSGTVYVYCDVRYVHNTANDGIKVGTKLKRGQVFMKEGMKGNATGNHVHISIKGRMEDGSTMSLMPERMFTINTTYNKFIKSKADEPVRIF